MGAPPAHEVLQVEASYPSPLTLPIHLPAALSAIDCDWELPIASICLCWTSLLQNVTMKLALESAAQAREMLDREGWMPTGIDKRMLLLHGPNANALAVYKFEWRYRPVARI